MKLVTIKLSFLEDEYNLLHPLEKIMNVLDEHKIHYDIFREDILRIG